MHFTRIKVTPTVVELDWSVTDPTGDKRTTTLESKARPMPALIQALAAFREFFVALIDVPASWADELRITTINVDEGKDGRTGLIITGVKPVAKAANRPLVLNTPQMREPMGEGDADMFLPADIVVLIRTAEVAATAYVNGEREQTELPLEPPAGAEAPKRGRRPRKGEFIPEVGPLANAGKDTLLDDADIRSRLMSRGRDVPLEAIARWTSSERDGVIRWLDTIASGEEPAVLLRDATPELLDDLIQREGERHVEKIGDVTIDYTSEPRPDEWTQENPPPKASEVEPVA